MGLIYHIFFYYYYLNMKFEGLFTANKCYRNKKKGFVKQPVCSGLYISMYL